MTETYLVVLEDSANAEVELGIFTSKTESIKAFEANVKEYTDIHNQSEITWYHNDETNREVTFESDGYGWTWYLMEYPLNEMQNLF